MILVGKVGANYKMGFSTFFGILGSSTACVLVLSRSDAMLYSANLGDSGFVVVRNGTVVHRSKEQTHCFNTPFQLSCLPPGQQGLSDRYAWWHCDL